MVLANSVMELQPLKHRPLLPIIIGTIFDLPWLLEASVFVLQGDQIRSKTRQRRAPQNNLLALRGAMTSSYKRTQLASCADGWFGFVLLERSLVPSPSDPSYCLAAVEKKRLRDKSWGGNCRLGTRLARALSSATKIKNHTPLWTNRPCVIAFPSGKYKRLHLDSCACD